MASITSESPEQTAQIAGEFAVGLRPGSVVAVEGTLGAGKTHFIKAAVRALGFGAPVTSPTFTIVHEYPTDRGSIFHIDLYRLRSEREIAALGLNEIFAASLATFIEWPERLGAHLPHDASHVKIGIASDTGRIIELPDPRADR